MLLRVKKTHPGAVLPRKAHETDAGFDLFMPEDDAVGPGEKNMLRTGVAVEIPPEHVGLVFERSSLNLKTGCSLTNAVGVIDSSFRDELYLSVHNTGTATAWFAKGDRLAQLVVVPVPAITIVEVDDLSDSDRGLNGWGSSGS